MPRRGSRVAGWLRAGAWPTVVLALLAWTASPSRAAVDPDTVAVQIDAARVDQDAGKHRDVADRLEPIYAEARRGPLDTPDHVRALLRLSNVLGRSWIPLNRFESLLQADEYAVPLARARLGPRAPETITATTDLMQSLARAGQVRRSVKLMRDIWPTARSVLPPTDPILVRLHMVSAYAHAAAGNNHEALLHDRAVLDLRQRSLPSDHPDLESALNNLSASLAALDQHEEATQLAERAYALRLARLGAAHHQTLVSTTGLAESYLAVGRHAEAKALAESALALRRAHFGPTHHDTLITTQVLFESLWKLGEHDEALRLSRDAVDAIELRRRAAGLSSAERQALHSVFALDLHMYARHHGAAGPAHWADGLVLTERARGRALTETMAQLAAKRRLKLSPDARQRLQALEDERARSSEAAAQSWRDAAQVDDRNRSPSAQQRLRDTEAAIATLLAPARGDIDAPADDDASALAHASDARTRVAAWAARLAPGEVYVSWMVDASGAGHAWTLDHHGRIAFFDLGKLPNVAALAKDVVATMRRPASTSADSSRRLSRWVLEPLRAVLEPAQRWLIAPEGALAFVPIEALSLGGEGGRPVAARHVISRVQSLDVLAALRDRARDYAALSQRHLLLAMGDPDYGAAADPAATSGDRRGLRGWNVAAARNADRKTRQADAGIAVADAPPLSALRWQRLPGTAREVARVAEVMARQPVPIDGGGGPPRIDILTGGQAAEPALRQLAERGDLRRYRYLLFAAHGYLSDEPALNSVVLTQPRHGAVDAAVADPQADGYITAAEWPTFDLRSDVVVISACDSGAGEALPGEGVIGLPFALAAAGNVHTLLTLWPVHDQATADFVTLFFQGLAEGRAPAEALAQTQRAFMRDRRYARARYWAGFVLYGP